MITYYMLMALSAAGPAQSPLASSLSEYLQRNGFSQNELDAIESGRAVSKLLDSSHDTETQILGVVKIHGRAEDLVSRFRDIENFEKGTGVLAIGLFSDPAQVADVAELTFDAQDLEDIENCRPGNCEIKLSDSAIEAFQGFEWKTDRSVAAARNLARQMIVDFIDAYRQGGNEALGALHDKKHPVLVKQQFEDMIANPDLIAYFPRVHAFLRDYPAAPIVGAEDFFYWSKVDFGLKPVIRLNHVLIYEPEISDAIRYALASKMLYTTHYFNTGLELKFLIDSRESPDAYYLVSFNQSRSDGLTGITGALIGGRIRGKARDGSQSYLTAVKRSMEQ